MRHWPGALDAALPTSEACADKKASADGGAFCSAASFLSDPGAETAANTGFGTRPSPVSCALASASVHNRVSAPGGPGPTEVEISSLRPAL